MASASILVMATIFTLIIAYFLLQGIFNVLQALIKNVRGSMKGIFILVGIIASIYLLSNPEYSDALWQEIKDRAEGIEHVERARYFDGDNS